MRSSTKNHLIAIVVTAIIILIVIWYITYPRHKYNKVYTLSQIIYNPLSNPLFTFTFSNSIATLVGSNAIIKEFTISPDTPAGDIINATKVINALLENGGVPFIPTILNPASITSNALPLNLINSPQSITINGTGVAWFSIPNT